MNKKKLIIIVVAVVVAIVLAIVGAVLISDKVSEGNNSVISSDQAFEGVNSDNIVATYGDISITKEDYSYGYMSLYNQVLSIVKQYDEYYPGYGAQYYDVSLSPAEQDCPATDLPEGVETWADYFAHYAVERAVLIKSLYTKAMSDEAKNDGFLITDEQQAEMDNNIDAFITALEEKADEEGITADEYISQNYGYGLNCSAYKEQLKREYISELYLSWYGDFLKENISKEDIDAYYLQNKEDIDVVSVRAYTVSYASSNNSGLPVYTRDEAKSIAESFLSELSDEQSFMDTAVAFAPDSMKTAYAESSATLVPDYTKADFEMVSSEMANWIFDSERKLYDSTVIEVEDGTSFFVIMITEMPHKNEAYTSADVRHLLVEYGDDKEASRKEAEALLQQYYDNGATEEAFIELVKVHTDDVASAETGGLYEGITSNSSYVAEFLQWAMAPHTIGDVEIVETTYGYHIMYYVGADTTPQWEKTVRSELSSMEYNIFYEKLYEDIQENTVSDDKKREEINVANLKMIMKYQGVEEPAVTE